MEKIVHNVFSYGGYHQFFNQYSESYRIKSSDSKLIRTKHEQRWLSEDDEFATPTLDVEFFRMSSIY